ncbi:hypothetical protein LY76DRAFT_63953 [Colletotrichum caudatum]|nr:hypothetical protein LY76DRAFT_63953 [Colletotrichum caudatum]
MNYYVRTRGFLHSFFFFSLLLHRYMEALISRRPNNRFMALEWYVLTPSFENVSHQYRPFSLLTAHLFSLLARLLDFALACPCSRGRAGGTGELMIHLSSVKEGWPPLSPVAPSRPLLLTILLGPLTEFPCLSAVLRTIVDAPDGSRANHHGPFHSSSILCTQVATPLHKVMYYILLDALFAPPKQRVGLCLTLVSRGLLVTAAGRICGTRQPPSAY